MGKNAEGNSSIDQGTLQSEIGEQEIFYKDLSFKLVIGDLEPEKKTSLLDSDVLLTATSEPEAEEISPYVSRAKENWLTGDNVNDDSGFFP